MLETTKNKIKYLNRQLLAIQLLERRTEERKENLEKWLESNADEIAKYVEGLRNDSKTQSPKNDHTGNFYVAYRMLVDGLPYHYVGKVTGLNARQLYTITAKIKGK